MAKEMTKFKRVMVEVRFALIGAYVFFTGCWIVWGFLTPADYFPYSDYFTPSLFLAIAAGALAGIMIKSKAMLYTLLALALAATLFWIFAPDGWWAKPPPCKPTSLSG